MDIYTAVFYVISKIRPKKEDVIIEIQPDLKHLDQPPKHVAAHELFDIKHVESKIDRGLAYSKCYCVKMTPANDETLAGSIPVKYISI